MKNIIVIICISVLCMFIYILLLYTQTIDALLLSKGDFAYVWVAFLLFVISYIVVIWVIIKNKQKNDREIEARVTARTNELNLLNENLRLELEEQKLAQAAFHQSEEQYRLTLDNMLEGCQIISHDWRYLYVNKAVAKHGRKSKNEILGRTMSEVFPGIEHSNVYAIIERCMKEKTNEHMLNEFEYENGSKAWFELSIQTVPEGVFILSYEITERKMIEAALRESEERYRFLFEHNPAPMLIYASQSLHILAVNEAFLKSYGYSEDEILAMFLFDLYPPDEKQPISDLAHNLQGHAYAGEWHHIKKDGSIINIIAISHDLVYKEQKARIAVITDITARIKAEEEIQQLNSTLEDRVAERTDQLVAINKELESFSYSISHDLRAPLRAIFGFSQILARRHRASLNEEGQQYMDFIVEASKRMEQLINDLLNYSRLGRKSLDLKPIALASIMKNIQVDFKQKIEEIDGNLLIDNDLPEILGDETLLRQIFTNLVENAITYRRTDVPLVIHISNEHVTDGYLLRIADNGIGISHEYWEKIFNIFQRLHNEEQYPGTGIGLATVRKAVGLQNGTVWVESVVGQGSTFFINFPEKNKN